MKRIYSDKRISRAQQQGSVVVELALMLPVLAIMILGSIDMGLIVREHQMLQNAAREGARFSAQPGSKIDATNPSATPESIRDRVINYLAQENITVTSTACTADATEAKRWNCGAITIQQRSPIVTVVEGTTFTDYGSSISVTYSRSFLFQGSSTVLKFNSVSLNANSVFRNLY